MKQSEFPTIEEEVGGQQLVWDGSDYLGSVPAVADEGAPLMPIRYHSAEGVMLGQTDFSPGAVRTDFACDMLGSVVAVLDENGDAILERRFKPYGGLLSGTNAPWGFGWTGNTGSRNLPLLYAEQYNRARHYSTSTKQWTTVDPLWPMLDSYSYVDGRVLIHIDSTGLNPACIGCGICVGVTAIGLLLSCIGADDVGDCIKCRFAQHPWLYGVVAICTVACAACIPHLVSAFPKPVPVPVGGGFGWGLGFATLSRGGNDPCKSKKARFYCTTKCSIYGPIECSRQVSGEAYGDNDVITCVAAKNNARLQFTATDHKCGCRFGHCAPCACTGR